MFQFNTKTVAKVRLKYNIEILNIYVVQHFCTFTTIKVDFCFKTLE